MKKYILSILISGTILSVTTTASLGQLAPPLIATSQQISVGSAVTKPSAIFNSPLHETRAVWLTTALRLDLPPVTNAPTQEAEMRQMVRECKTLGLNTIIFQAVARGDAMYPSELLPWSPWITGEPELDPNWDPFAVIIDEAHRIGLEVHAWINVFKVGDSETPRGISHVINRHPDWIERMSTTLGDGSVREEFWINPANEDARNWMVDNVLEVVESYDIDGIHFDYLRYPSQGFPTDLDNFISAGGIDVELIHDWRRANVTAFVETVYPAIIALKPYVKVGAAPLGNYQQTFGAPPALWAFSDTFQESRAWLNAGIHDYLVPQVYFSMGNAPNYPGGPLTPDFAAVAEEWTKEAGGRPIYIGIGTYKPDVQDEIPAEVRAVRQVQAHGQVYFRYEFVDQPAFAELYRYPAFPTPMPWKSFAPAPDAPAGVELIQLDDHNIELSWDAVTQNPADPLLGYAIFRTTDGFPNVKDPSQFYALIGATETSLILSENHPHQYTIVAVSRLGRTSESTLISAQSISNHSNIADKPAPPAGWHYLVDQLAINEFNPPAQVNILEQLQEKNIEKSVEKELD